MIPRTNSRSLVSAATPMTTSASSPRLGGDRSARRRPVIRQPGNSSKRRDAEIGAGSITGKDFGAGASTGPQSFRGSEGMAESRSLFQHGSVGRSTDRPKVQPCAMAMSSAGRD